MNNLYRFLRCAMVMAIMMVCMMSAMAQHPFTLTTASDITYGTQHYYLIQSIDRLTFYAIPHTDVEGSKVSTTSIPNANMRWYFMNAGSDSDHQYYYIVNSTGRCLYRYDDNNDGIQIKKTYAELSSLSDNELDKYKYYLTPTGSYYYIHPKDAPNLYLNKRGTNPNYADGYYIKASTYTDSPSVWNFVAVGDVTWPQPFTTSTNVEKHYYKFQNVNNTSFYLSNAGEWATVSNTGSNENVWYFWDAGTDATYSNCHYYYIVNASTGKYLYYTGGTSNDVAKIMVYNSEQNDNYRFLIVDAAYKPNNTNYATCYTIVPKQRQTSFSGKDSFAPMAMNDDSHLLLKSDRGSNNSDSHWNIVLTDYVAVEAPTITNNFDGTISLNTTTPNATIYYTTNGDTPDNTCEEYSSPFSLGNATIIKAIAYLGSDYSNVKIYNVPKYTKPTISFDNNTSLVTITSEGTVYYNTGDGTQDDPTPSSGTLYSEPFNVSPDITVKAIATHAGYLNSDVATWPTTQGYLTFNVLTKGTICWKAYGNSAKTIEYSINDGAWTPITSTTNGVTFSVEKDDVVRFKGSDSTYATDKSNYSGFDGGTATYNISGNIMSLIYGDNFEGQTTLTGTYNFCSLFKQSKAVSAENLILPATTLTNYCYRAMFSYCTSLSVAPVLPAPTLAQGCYWYMFEKCAISTAPDLNATTLVNECYGHMFENAGSLNYIQCLATAGFNAYKCLEGWTTNVASSGFFVKDTNVNWATGTSGIPSDWKIYNDFFLYSPEISCDGEFITITCATEGASIYYRLNQTGDFSLYTDPISINTNTTVEAYSTKDNNTSNTVSITLEKYDSPLDESTRSLDTWTYGNTQITLPYSINGENGHSSNYSRGTYTFETTITLYKLQPTYLWFLHADQSADIYVDDVFVTTHWGGYNAFFVDISNNVHVGTNRIKVVLNNTKRNTLAPYTGDFNFNATLGKVKLLTSPVLPSMDYGYDGMHITSSVTDASATINIKTSIPEGASVVCKIDADDENYHFTETKPSTGSEITFTTIISNPHLWNGTEDPFLYNVTLEIYHNNELYHRFERPYGFRYYDYVYNNTSILETHEPYTGFLLNGKPYLLRGVCMHHDLEGKANALTDADIANDFTLIQELGCNFIRLAHYPHPKEVFDWCDRLGIIVQTEAPCVNDFQSTLPQDYYDHLYIQYEDMVRQHFNHPCIMFWGLGNEIKTDNTTFAKTKLDAYRTFIKSIDSERWVGYVVDHGKNNPSSSFGNPDMDWFGCNIYVGWYIDKTTNNPTNQLNTRKTNIITNLHKPLAFSEYGCGGTQHCHSDDFLETTTSGNNPRHDIEYQMWLHEGHIAAIKTFPELLFTSQWQLFDIAVSNRQEGYTICLDGENASTDNDLKYLNNKGLVERDHKTKKDPFYLYKAWWNQTDKFVHICGKDYKKLTDRVIKCYTNDGNSLSLYVNNSFVETVQVTDNIATFTARTFIPGDVIRVEGENSNDTFTFTDYNSSNVFTTNGNWNVAANWSGNAVPDDGSDVVIMANATVPSGCTANAENIDLYGGSLTIEDGGQLIHSNEGVTATVEKSISAYTVEYNHDELLTNGWYFIASPITNGYTPTGSMVENNYDLYRLNPATTGWENYKNTTGHPNFTTLNNGAGYLYANEQNVTLSFTGTIKPYTTESDAHMMDIASGYNLIGNPYTFAAYIDKPYYSLNENRNTIVPTEIKNEPINPCTGVIGDGGENGVTVGFYKESQSIQAVNNGNIQMTLAQTITTRGNSNVETLDKAIVSFNEGDQLGKLYFGTQNANIYIPLNGKEYAIVSAEAQGEMPVNFEAQENGIYTITVKVEDVEMSYLHLIDNMTGANVDLLLTPSYSFEAKTTDYVSRFKLVFSANMANDNLSDDFAFFSNGQLIIANEGEASLQVIDVTGRVVATENINGTCSKTVNVKAGVYVLRLVNGNDVKTQKIVIK